MKHLGRLPHEVVATAPEHQLMLALALLALEEEEAAAALRARAAAQREAAQTPAKWKRIHAAVDRAAAAMRDLN